MKKRFTITTADLRVGNILNYDTAEGETVTTVVDWQDIKWVSEDPEGFNLVHSIVPLTDEWLNRFGFEKQKNNWWKLLICNEWSFLYWERLAGTELSVNKHSIMLPHIQYVHQLQNLFFCLFGEELKINQP